MKKNLFILEDDPNAMPIVDWLKGNHNLEVIHARTLEDAVYYLEYCSDAPIESYDYFLFDAYVPGATVPSITNEIINFHAEDGLNGIILFVRYRDKIAKSNAKVAFMTAFSSQIKNRKEITDVPTIDKTSENFIKDLSEFLA